MKAFIIGTLLSIVFFSCKDKNKDTPAPKSEKETMPASLATTAINLLGSYVGQFGDNKITLLITKNAGDTIIGRSIVGGNDRPFMGMVQNANGKYTINAKEPGDNQYDGAFNLTIDAAKPDEVTGIWTPNNPTANLKEKAYTLQRKEFKYVPAVGEYAIASTRLLKADDVENLMKPELEYMRNEIFARHGYCFQKKDLRQQFEMQDWYVPNTIDIKKDLTEIEKKNIVLIKHYEKYAEDYSDDYGR